MKVCCLKPRENPSPLTLHQGVPCWLLLLPVIWLANLRGAPQTERSPGPLHKQFAPTPLGPQGSLAPPQMTTSFSVFC